MQLRPYSQELHSVPVSAGFERCVRLDLHDQGGRDRGVFDRVRAGQTKSAVDVATGLVSVEQTAPSRTASSQRSEPALSGCRRGGLHERSGGRITPAWGDEVVEEMVDGRPCRVYRHRRHSVAELVTDLGRWGSRASLVQGDRAVSFTELVRHIDAVAADMSRGGVCEGSRVLLLAGNSQEWVTVFWAIFRAGGVAVPGNAWWSASEIEHAAGLIEPDQGRVVPQPRPAADRDLQGRRLRGEHGGVGLLRGERRAGSGRAAA